MRDGHTEVVARPSVLLTIAQPESNSFATVSRYTSQNGSSKTGLPGLEVMRGGHTEVVARPSVLLTIAQPELKTCQPGYNSYFLNMHMPARPNSFATVSRNTSQNQS